MRVPRGLRDGMVKGDVGIDAAACRDLAIEGNQFLFHALDVGNIAPLRRQAGGLDFDAEARFEQPHHLVERVQAFAADQERLLGQPLGDEDADPPGVRSPAVRP